MTHMKHLAISIAICVSGSHSGGRTAPGASKDLAVAVHLRPSYVKLLDAWYQKNR